MQQSIGLLHVDGFDSHILVMPMKNTTQMGGVIIGGAEGQPVLTTKLCKDYIYSFRGDSSLLG